MMQIRIFPALIDLLQSNSGKTTMKRDTVVLLNPENILRLLSFITLILIVAGFIAQVFQHLLGHPIAWGFVPLFNLGFERSAPTFFSTVILLFAAVLIAFIALTKGRQRFTRHWVILSLIFFFLSIDEAAGIHEQVGYNLQRFTGPGEGIFTFLWVIPYALLVVVFVAYYVPFLINLPKRTRIFMILSGAIYVGGALGTELLEGWNEGRGFTHGMIVTLQESLEIIGIVLFIYTLLYYMRETASEIHIRIA